MAGWNTFSTKSMLIGQQLSLLEAISFPDHVTRGGFVFPDEVHSFVDRYSVTSVRNRTFTEATTTMRREEINCLGASAQAGAVGYEYLGSSEWLVYPNRWYPKKYHFPDWCYIQLTLVGPYYHRRDDPVEEIALGKQRQLYKREFVRLDPEELYHTAKLYDTFEVLRLGEMFDLGAREMKEGRDGVRETKMGHEELKQACWKIFVNQYANGYFSDKNQVYYKDLQNLMIAAGVPVPSINEMASVSRDLFENSSVKVCQKENLLAPNLIQYMKELAQERRDQKVLQEQDRMSEGQGLLNEHIREEQEALNEHVRNSKKG